MLSPVEFCFGFMNSLCNMTQNLALVSLCPGNHGSMVQEYHTNSNFAELDSSILAQVFVCQTLSISDKQRCESVCTAWRALLDCSFHEYSRGLWWDKVVLELDCPRRSEHITVTDSRSVLAGSRDAAFSQRQQLFITWLSKRLYGICQLQLSPALQRSYRMHTVVAQLHSSYIKTPGAPSLSLSISGISRKYCKRCEDTAAWTWTVTQCNILSVLVTTYAL